MNELEELSPEQLLIRWLDACERLSNEDWFRAVGGGSPDVADNELADQYWSTIERRMLMGAAEIKQLREERDDARRELCIGLADHTHSTFTLPDGCLNQLRVERARGWDCFKEKP